MATVLVIRQMAVMMTMVMIVTMPKMVINTMVTMTIVIGIGYYWWC
jgi:hypothetical protein